MELRGDENINIKYININTRYIGFLKREPRSPSRQNDDD